MASLSTCHLELVVWDGNLVKSCNICYKWNKSWRKQTTHGTTTHIANQPYHEFQSHDTSNAKKIDI